MLSLNIKNKNVNCAIASKTCETKVLLSIAKFIRCCVLHKKIVIKHLETCALFLEGCVNVNPNDISLEQIDNEIDLLQRIIILEDYYKKDIGSIKTVTKNDFDLISYDSQLIDDGEILVHWLEFSIPIVITSNTKKYFEKMKKEIPQLACIGTVPFSLFNEEYKLLISRTKKNISVKNNDSIMKKLQVMDVGDSITIEFISSSDESVFIDKFYSGELPNIEELIS